MQKTGLLPAEYTQVEYIQAIGTQYIKTDIIPKFESVDEFYIRFNLQDAGTQIYFGVNGYNVYNGRSIQGVYANGKIRNDLRLGGSWEYFGDLSINTWAEYHVVGKSVSCLGETLTVSNSSTNNQEYLYLFAQGTSEPSTNAKCKISNVWYKHEGVYTMQLIPCIRKYDNKPGMYDIVSKTFYTNAGTGEFIVPL